MRSKGIKISVTDDEGILLDTYYMETEATRIAIRALPEGVVDTKADHELEIGKVG